MADFLQAVGWMKEGRKVRRKHWSKEICIYQSGSVIKFNNEFSAMMMDAYLEHDWELLKPEKYYIFICPECKKQVYEEDMGKKCKHCNNWLYYHLSQEKSE